MRDANKISDPIVKPSRFRRQHGRIERVGETMQDAAGDIGHPFRAEGLLAQLERRGDIDGKQRQAGEEFHRLFRLACLDPLQAQDMARTRISGSRHAQSGSEAARWQIRRALETLGEPAGSVCWFVIGCETSMREFSLRQDWGKQQMRVEVVKGTLLAALGTLAQHFGLDSGVRQNLESSANVRELPSGSRELPKIEARR